MPSFTSRSFRLPRLWSNQVLRTLAPHFSGEVINVSGWDDRDKEGSQYRNYFVNAAHYHISNHAGERGLSDATDVTDFAIDLAGPLDDSLRERFDVVFNHTTLEHIFEVEQAFGNLCAMSRDIVIVIVPFAQEVHFTESYGDYWRFTPMGVRRLFEQNGFEVVYEAGSTHRNAGVYLAAVGTRHPDRWRGVLPTLQPVDELGGWIGESWRRRLKRALRLT